MADTYRTVVLDWDSTVSRIEGIEHLARARHAEVVAMTEAAMRGEVPLEEVYGRRLEIVRPSRAQVEALAREYLATLVPDAQELVAALHAAGIEVRVISGGLRPAVAPAAETIGIPANAVAAVDAYFTETGEYAGFDSTSPLARAGGKREVLEQWRHELPRPIMLVGDGATDLEARPAVDRFVAFAGVVERPNVVAAADAVIRAASLAPVLALALGAEPAPDFAYKRLYEKGLELLNTRFQ